jgi:hypothetical protein
MFCWPCFGNKKKYTDAVHEIFSLKDVVMSKDAEITKLKKTLISARLKLAGQAEEIKYLRSCLDRHERPLACADEIIYNTHRDKPASL